jgi:O-antigen ligase
VSDLAHPSAPEPPHGSSLANLSPEALRRLTFWMACFGLFILMLTLQPFARPPEPEDVAASSGNILNQISYVTLAAIYLAAILCFAPRQVLMVLLAPGWLVVFAVAAVSVRQAADPASALRGLILTAIIMVIIAGVLVLPRSSRDFTDALVSAALSITALVYLVLLLAPGLATHAADAVESWHAGLWRGHLSHKNMAAPFFSILAMVGIYAWWKGMRWRGALLVVLGVLFVLESGSKTTLGFLPLAIGLVMLTRLTGRPGLAVAAHLGLTALVLVLTLGTVIWPEVREFVASIMDDVTFTGRDDIWKLALARIPDRFWTGYGYFGFWLGPSVLGMDPNIEAAWDARKIVSGHNNFLDAMLMFGVPGGLLISVLLLGLPLVHYLKAHRWAENRDLADLFVMIVFLMTYVSMLESFFLNRADALWVMATLAIFGLGLIARVRVNPG